MNKKDFEYYFFLRKLDVFANNAVFDRLFAFNFSWNVVYADMGSVNDPTLLGQVASFSARDIYHICRMFNYFEFSDKCAISVCSI